MKHLLLTTIAAVVLVGCGPSVDIWTAADKGNIEAVKQHIAAGTDLDAKMQGGHTPLLYATLSGHREIAELLIANGADVNVKGVEGWTPLDIAIEWKYTELADFLRKHGGKTGAEFSIHVASGMGNIEAVKQHIAEGADVNAKSDAGWTPLHHASRRSHKAVAELLIAEGADVNAKFVDGSTPLHMAANKEIVELLVAEGADVNAKGDRGNTPLDSAIRRKHLEVADLLRKHGGKSGAEDSIHVAAELGNIEAVKQHIAKGADVNAKFVDGSTPLHNAASGGHKEIVELLIASGADVNAKDGDGFTPLDVAEITAGTSPPEFKAGLEEVADLLRKHGGKTGAELL
jgi:ankyrin repeat protein